MVLYVPCMRYGVEHCMSSCVAYALLLKSEEVKGRDNGVFAARTTHGCSKVPDGGVGGFVNYTCSQGVRVSSHVYTV